MGAYPENKIDARARPRAHFVAGDWGTTSLKLYLCAQDGTVLAQASGRGVSALGIGTGDQFGIELEQLCRTWPECGSDLPVVLCGMVGANIGWRETPYVLCPADVSDIARQVTRFQTSGRSISIIPGVACSNRFGAPDFMRGEETLVFGAIDRVPELGQTRHLLGLPGTHSKWVRVVDGRIERFCTSIAGELYAALSDHSVLLRGAGRVGETDMAAFQRGVDRVGQQHDADLLQLLFETRSRQLHGDLAPECAASFLSGLIIGSDVAGALGEFSSDPSLTRRVTLVGATELSLLHAAAFAAAGIETVTIDAALCVVAGLKTLLPEVSA